jgi:hypothetical protein
MNYFPLRQAGHPFTVSCETRPRIYCDLPNSPYGGPHKVESVNMRQLAVKTLTVVTT